jgi:hypothetical protein
MVIASATPFAFVNGPGWQVGRPAVFQTIGGFVMLRFDCRLLGLLLSITLLLLSAPPRLAVAAEPANDHPATAPAGEKTNELQPLAPPIDGSIRQLLQDRNYAEALRVIHEAMARDGAPLDYLTYLKGRALFFQGEYAKAAQVLSLLDTSFPDSPWRRRARFDAAQAYARQRDFQAAEAIYRTEAEDLFGPERKQQIADIYLQFAGAAFNPDNDQAKPDYRKALEFYLAALDVGPKPEKRPEIEMLIARCHQQLGDTGTAAEDYARFIKTCPDSDMVVDARFRLGECQLAENKPAEARRTWQDLLASDAGSESPRIAEAAFRLAETWGIPEPPNAVALDLGVASLRSFLERFPKHENAAKARLWMGESYLHQERFAEAADCLQVLLDDPRFAGSDQIPQARNLLGHSFRLQKKYDDAIRVWREFLAAHTADERWNNVQQAIIDTEYLRAGDYYQQEEFDKARQHYNTFLAQYPLDPRCPAILFLLGEIAHREAKWDEAVTAWKGVASKYPDRPEAGDAQFRIAETFEQDLHQFEQALQAYRAVKQGQKTADAHHAVARLSEKRLAVVTERVFRTDEPARLSLTTRNIEAVTVRTYPIDIETYFRKMHRTPGVEQLDITLIDPDETIEFQVPGYQEYREIRSTIELPFPEGTAGVMAVTVSSRRREATTVVIRSDLDVIVKSSRNEIFVFAQNMLTGKSWPDVRLLVSDGKTLLAEGKSGQDGVFRQAFEQLADTDNVCVLAMLGDHIASSAMELRGLTIARGLEDEGYLYTDRPAYRAGEEVHLRGWIRRVLDDKYVAEEGRKCTLQVFDVRDRMLREQQVVLSRFGAFHDRFVLPAESPQGEYRLLVRDEENRTCRGAFVVHQYKPEPIRLVVDCPRRVYYRGETIEGTIRAEHYYGAPVAGQEVRYSLAGGDEHTAVTGAEGLVRFSFPTREFLESQPLALQVSLPRQNVETTANFFLATQGYSISLSTTRPLFLSGESFEVTAKTLTPEGEPLGQTLTLKVFERTQVAGNVGERLAESYELATAESDGIGRVTVTLKEGGEYVLRAEGTDRFNNPVSASADVAVSADDDRNRLRILADRHTYKVGDQADLPLHWRGDPARALVTFQGTGILGYRLVELKTGRNTLPVTFGADLAPNFELSVALMSDGDRKAESTAATTRFHEASSPFAVQRDLVVQMQWKRAGDAKEPLRPGDRLEVTLTTTDPQRKPVAAEISLAMIEQSLLDRFEWPAADISTVFRGSLRTPQMRTGSSIRFEYRPETIPINPQLLSEQERIEIAREEEESRQLGVGYDPYGQSAALGGYAGDLDVPADGYDSGMGAMGGLGGMTMGGGPSRSGTTRTESARGVASVPFGDNDPFGAPPAEDPFARDSGMADFDSRIGLITGVIQEFGATLRTAAAEAENNEPLHARDPQAAAYWNPAITTDENGRATVTIPLPEQSTAWCLMAKAITVDTLVGQAETPLVVKKDLFGQMKLPLAFTDGDIADIPVSIHHDTPAKAPIEVTLKTTVGSRSLQETQTIEAAEKDIIELVFQREFLIPDAKDLDQAAPAGSLRQIEFELSVKSGDRQDRVRRTVPLLPFGANVYAARGGSATGDATTWVEPPQSMPLASPSLQILVGPTVERSLLDAVLGEPSAEGLEPFVCTSGAERSAADLMAALALQDLLAKTGASDRPEMIQLDRRIRSAIASLVASQKDDGGWSWAGAENPPDRNVTASALWALSLAGTAGFPLPDKQYNLAVQHVRDSVTATDNADYTGKAVLLHALTIAGQADFNLANRLQRVRNELSTSALLHLALTFTAMDRRQPAAELLQIVAGRNLEGNGPPSAYDDRPSAELRALYALALEEVSPASGDAGKMVDWLLANRTGRRWSPDTATGPAVTALARWFGAVRFETERYRLDVFVANTQVGTLDVNPSSPSQVIDVPASLITKGRQEIRFQMTGRGRYTYQCMLTGFVPAGELRSTTDSWLARRVFEPAPLEAGGRQIGRGFHIVEGAYKSFRNPLTQLPVGRRAIVQLGLQRRNAAEGAGAQQEYLLVHETIPSGTEVVADSVTGSFDHYEITPGGITFYLGNWRRPGTIRYELHGVVPGQYRAAPTLIRNAYRPEQMFVAEAMPLSVIPAGQESSDPYRLTPVELFELGTWYYEQGLYEQAAKHLGELVANWSLRQATYQNVVPMLLDVHLELGPPEEIVRYFEILIERWPDREISFEKGLKIGAAYHEMGEFERSYIAFRGSVEGRFMKELSAGGFLESQDEFLRSVAFVDRLLQEYPSEGYAANAAFSLAQRVYSKAAEAAGSQRLRAARITRIDLVRQAAAMLDDFLTVFPEDPAADQAAFARANALLEMNAYQEAVAACNRYADRYPRSDLLDSFWYLIGYCHFAAGRHEEALDMCRKVSQATHLDQATGRQVDARNKWLAIYILGQIHHSLDRPQQAIEQYRRVADRFNDARSSIEDLLRKRIRLPELTTVAPDSPVELELEFRNLASCDVKVYRIDLMKFGLLRRDLGGISRVNLAGVRPRHDEHVSLGDGLDYRDRTRKLTLPLKEEGAYLVVCRGDDLHASGLVILSPLSLAVHHDAESGEVRATVKNAVENRAERGAHIKIIGSRNTEFVSGSTDLRGIFVAQGIRGSATVIALVEPSRYALHRGAGDVAPAGPTVHVELPPTAVVAGGAAIGTDAAEQRIKAVLGSPATINLKDASLTETAAYIGRLYGINVQIDTRSLEDVNLSPDDTLVTANLGGMSLRSALRLILGKYDLTYVIRDEVLMITTPEEAELQATTKLYPVTDLVRYKDPSGEAWPDYDSLISLISSTIQPEAWEDVGGPGSISPMSYQGTEVIAIRQTDEVHDEIASLLARMRAMAEPRDDHEPPVRQRPENQADMYRGMGGMGGGMGGMGGGGLGGMGGGFGAPSGRKTDLLEGLHDTNRQLQGEQSKQLDKMYKEGGSMGGMGGGFF